MTTTTLRALSAVTAVLLLVSFVSATATATDDDFDGVCTPKYAPGDYTITLASGRAFVLYVPPSSLPSVSLSSVLVHIHGCGVLKTTTGFRVDRPDYENDLTHINVTAAAAGMMVAYPIGTDAKPFSCESLGGLTPLGLNAGACCGLTGVDDVAYITLIVQHLLDVQCANATRVFASGFSNGAMMAHRLACQAPRLFRGFAAVEGNLMLGGDFLACEPPASTISSSFSFSLASASSSVSTSSSSLSPPSMLLLCGTDDVICNLAFNETVSFWRLRMGCGEANTATVVFDTNTTTCYQQDNCNGGTASSSSSLLQWCTIKNLGHCWSGENDDLRVGICPKQPATDVDASQHLVQFFAGLP